MEMIAVIPRCYTTHFPSSLLKSLKITFFLLSAGEQFCKVYFISSHNPQKIIFTRLFID